MTKEWTLVVGQQKPAEQWARPGKPEWTDFVFVEIPRWQAFGVIQNLAGELKGGAETAHLTFHGAMTWGLHSPSEFPQLGDFILLHMEENGVTLSAKEWANRHLKAKASFETYGSEPPLNRKVFVFDPARYGLYRSYLLDSDGDHGHYLLVPNSSGAEEIWTIPKAQWWRFVYFPE